MKKMNDYGRRALSGAAALGLAAALGGCASDLLQVENPQVIGEDFLDQTTSVPALVATTVSDFQRAYTDLAYAGAILSDEAVTGHNFFQWQEFDLRIVDEQNSILDNVYEPIQIARGTGDKIVDRLRTLVPNASNNADFAKALTYVGYDYVMLGEYFCSAPLDGKSAAVGSDEILKVGIQRFDEAIRVAQAAGDKQTENLARVGAARAALNRGDKAAAIAYATPVPAGFVAYVHHASDKGYQTNPFYGATTGTNHNLGVDAAFRNLDDPRVRHYAKARRGHNGTTDLFTPYAPSSFAGWKAEKAGGFTRDMDVRFASGLEAQYIVAEATGPTTATIDFVESRRSIAPAGTAPTTAENFYENLRDQRRRDFFLAGHRLGDLRRYKKLYEVDQFPTGAHPNPAYGSYGTAECYVPHMDERIGNPGY